MVYVYVCYSPISSEIDKLTVRDWKRNRLLLRKLLRHTYRENMSSSTFQERKEYNLCNALQHFVAFVDVGSKDLLKAAILHGSAV